MKVQFSHLFSSSFVQWFDHTLLQEGQAFTNYGGKFYEMKDDKLAGYSVYSLPFGQVVGDSSISGAQIPSGVFVNGSFIPRGGSGLHIDFQRGRAIFSGGKNGLNVSGNISIKEFDVLLSPMPEEKLLISSKFSLKPTFSLPQTGLASNEYQFPVVFVSRSKSEDDPFQIGESASNHVVEMRALIMAQNDWQLDGIESIFTAKKHKYLPYLPNNPYPFDYFGDVLSGGYNYQNLQNSSSPDHLIYIKEARFSKFSNRANDAINPLVFMGVMEFTLELRRI